MQKPTYTYLLEIPTRSVSKPFGSIRSLHNFLLATCFKDQARIPQYDRLRYFLTQYDSHSWKLGKDHVYTTRTVKKGGKVVGQSASVGKDRVYLVECHNSLAMEKICQHIIKAKSKQLAHDLFFELRNDLNPDYCHLIFNEQLSKSKQPSSNL